ncbi:MAG: hypothetical protein R6V59_02655 [Dehalococcoidia bacterium]
MPGRIFVDTSAFLALEDAGDQHHQEALRFRDRQLLSGSYEVITVMQDLGIQDAFTFDEHFVQVGFARAP